MPLSWYQVTGVALIITTDINALLLSYRSYQTRRYKYFVFLFALSCTAVNVHTDMGDDDRNISQSENYSELYDVVTELREKLKRLESSLSPPTTVTTQMSAPTVDFRILPDVGTAVWTFTGHESSAQAEDWVNSVDGLAQVNQWPLRAFRKTFVRTLRKADLWRVLEARVQTPGEPTIDYFSQSTR